MLNNYFEAKEELKNIVNSYSDINFTYDSSLKQITHYSSSKELDKLHFDKSKLGIRIFIFLFNFGMLLIAGRKNITTPFILYGASIGLFITLISTITKKTTTIIDFEKKAIRINNKTIKFSNCKNFSVETRSLNFIPIVHIVTIDTGMGKVNVSLFSVQLQDKDIAYDIAHWANKYIVC